MRRGDGVLWALRVAWIVTGASAWGVVGGLRSLDPADRWVLTAVGGLLWLIGVGAIAIVSTVGLTTARVVIPFSVPAAIALTVSTPVDTGSVLMLAGALIATAITLSAPFGAASVQASAYGDEIRCPLRPPVGYLLASLIAFVISAALVLGAGLALAAGRRPLAIGLAIVAVGAITASWPRWHRLSRRWLVLVPAGVVVHDPIVLADTIMLRRSALAGIGLAPLGTSALDLSGPTSGPLIEIRTTSPQPVTLAPAGRRRAPTGQEVTAFLIGPTRPGYALERCVERRIPVG